MPPPSAKVKPHSPQPLKIALETLGYVPTNHGWAVVYASPAELDMWIEAIRAKFYEEGAPYGRAEWDRLLGDFQAVSDVPHILFAEELIAAYPEAKVVLTTRSFESWWKSYEATICGGPEAHVPRYGKYQYLNRLCFAALFGTNTVTEDVARACFMAHYDEVRRLTPKGRLLEFEVKEGWAPLVTFLDKEAPATAFPRVNDTAQFLNTISAHRRAVSWAWASKIAGLTATVVAVAAMLGYLGNARMV
ncbi:hypothetical protein B0H17DRAFT_1156251 [Mycena rosella]|uniref:Uncharacterized protein n=1 Tax=Mycena rosella TaxID=1033263 RepID=A0AAD7MA86_MYCRO|nr:hypothetical protein B0H17DRAFT_1156251 [Mycena rosella]